MLEELTDQVVSEKLYGKLIALSRWVLVLATGCLLTSLAFSIGLLNEFVKATEENPVDMPLVMIIGGIATVGGIVALILVWFYYQLHKTIKSDMALLDDWKKVINRLMWFFVLSGLMSVVIGAVFAVALGKELRANLGW